MAYEDLLKSVEESAEEKEQELRKRAAAEMERIRNQAQQQADDIRKAAADEARRSVATERNKTLYLVRAENKEQLIRVREAAFDRAFREAEARLQNLRADPKYPAVFQRLLAEAAATTGDDPFIVHIDPRDEALCRSTLAALGLDGTIQADLATAGGVIVTQQGGAITVANTVESRLERAREHNRQTIHAILAGG